MKRVKNDAAEPENNRVKAMFRTRAFRVGSYSTLASLIVIALAVAVVLIVSAVPSQYTKLDLTQNRLFSLSDQTKKLAAGLGDEVDITLLARTGREDAAITELLNRYRGLSDKIKVNTKDPVAYPNFAKQYTSDTVQENSLVVQSGGRTRYVGYDDIYVPDYTNYYLTGNQSDVTTNFEGESAITSAIDYVTSTDLPKAYVLTGHGEKSLSTTVTDLIAKQNIDRADLDLLSAGSVPDDCDCLLICGPSSDISSAEKDAILEYLQAGGHMLLLTDYSSEAMPNLALLMQNYGVKAEEGIVFEGDSAYSLQGYNYYLLPKIGSHAITEPLENNYRVLMPAAQGITETGDARSTVTVTKLLTTSDSSYAKKDPENLQTTDRETGDAAGPFALGVAITEKTDSGETDIVWYSTTNFLEDGVDQYVSGTNLDLFANSLNWMCSRESSISITAKTLESSYLTVSDAAVSLWSFVIVGVIPLLFLAAGLGVWISRRRR